MSYFLLIIYTFYEISQAILTELRSYNEKAEKLNRDVSEIPGDLEIKRLLASLAGIRTKIVTLLTQTEQSHAALAEACTIQEKRDNEIKAYKEFLDETSNWLETTVLTINNFSASDCEVCAKKKTIFYIFQKLLEKFYKFHFSILFQFRKIGFFT